MMRRGLGFLLGLFVLGLLAACQPQTQFLNQNITGSGLKTQVPLTDTVGQTLQLNDASQKVTAVFFGFTSCPEVCPTTLGELKIVRQQLGADADKFRIVFVSLDPERDTTAAIEQYMNAFGAGFIGASTDLAHTQAIAKDLGFEFKKMGDGAFYMIQHPGNIYLVDGQGRFRVSVPYGAAQESVTHDVKQLLSEKP